MQNINITNSTVTIINNNGAVSKAKDKLLTVLYHARNKNTIGGYNMWLKLLDMYFVGNYKGMYNHIKACRGYGVDTRKNCLDYLETIMGGNN